MATLSFALYRINLIIKLCLVVALSILEGFWPSNYLVVRHEFSQGGPETKTLNERHMSYFNHMFNFNQMTYSLPFFSEVVAKINNE